MSRNGRLLVDTSAWIDTLRKDGDPVVRSQVTAAVTAGTAVLCDLVLLELWNGARGTAEMEMLQDLERDLETVETTPAVWAAAREMARTCRQRGITVPATDLVIAACAESHGLSLLHRDRHFTAITQAQDE